MSAKVPPEPPRTGGLRHRPAGGALAAGRWLRHVWRSSLHVRVITITTLLGLTITILLGTYLYQRIADGLVQERMSAAMEEAAQATRRAQNLFDSTDRTDTTNLSVVAWDTVQDVASPDDARQVVLARALSNDRAASVSTVVSDTDIGLSAVPRELRAALDQDSNHQQVTLIRAPGAESAEPVPTVLIGARVQVPRAGPYDLFFFFPMEREQETLQLVQRTFLGGAAALALLVGAVSYAVTRLVVTPVRGAALTSERLARGELHQRMPVRGEDDLARLATSFNQMADSLQTQIRQLEDLSRVQHRFVSDVSHELRTPLTTMRMAGEILYASREDFESSLSRSAELLYAELDRFESLLTDLLEISRFDAGAAAPDLEATDVREVVQLVVDGSRSLGERHGSTLSVSAPEQPVHVDMDPRRVARILRNLVGNAIEHGEGKPIEITVAQSATAAAVSVRDQGIGLKPEQAGQVFDRFWRADPARTRTTGGTGLGLAIAQEDAHLHHGLLQANGEVGRGACFRLALPKRAGTGIVSPPPPVPRDPAGDGQCPLVAVSLAPDDRQPVPGDGRQDRQERRPTPEAFPTSDGDPTASSAGTTGPSPDVEPDVEHETGPRTDAPDADPVARQPGGRVRTGGGS